MIVSESEDDQDDVKDLSLAKAINQPIKYTNQEDSAFKSKLSELFDLEFVINSDQNLDKIAHLKSGA